MRKRQLGFGHARRALGPFVGPRFRWLLGGLAMLGLALGLVEALILGVIGELVGSIELGDSVRSLGPLKDLTITGLVVIGGVATTVLIGLRLLETLMIARIGVHPLTIARTKLASTFLQADYEAQQALTSSTYHELVLAHAVRLGSIAMSTATMVSAIVVALALSVAAISISPAAFVVLAGVMLLVVAATAPLNSLAQKLGRALADGRTELANESVEMVNSATDARLYGVEPAVFGALDDRVRQVTKTAFRTHTVNFFGSSLFQALMLGVLIGLTGIVASVGGEGFAAAGTVALLALRAQMSARKAVTSNLSIATSAPFATELEAQLSLLEERPVTGELEIDSVERFEAQQVSFSYRTTPEGRTLAAEPATPPRDSASSPTVISGIDLVVDAGEHVGIIGASGSGKSTFLAVLLGLLEPATGAVLINGHPLGSYNDAAVRSHVASVQQTPSLITATVAENIRFLRPGISEDQVHRAATLAGIIDEIESWPNGFETVIGERGVRQVSGGQAQRICIARALAGNPSLLIMDEPTSSVDATSEQLILDTLTALPADCAAIIVSHRPTALGSCDRILELTPNGLTPRTPATDLDVNN